MSLRVENRTVALTGPLLIGVSLAVSACAPPGMDSQREAPVDATPVRYEVVNPHLPLARSGGTGLEARATGELVLEGRCLRLRTDDHRSLLLIWPAGSGVVQDPRGVWRVSVGGDLRGVSVGDRVTVDGGLVPAQGVARELQNVIAACGGPAWVASRVF